MRAALLGVTIVAGAAVVVPGAPDAAGSAQLNAATRQTASAVLDEHDPTFVPPDSVYDDPAIRDLELAERRIADTAAEIASLERQIAADLDEIDRLLVERDFLDLNGPARALTLAQARDEARQSSMAAYVGYGVTAAEVNFIDAQSISDATYRNALLRQLAERINEKAYIYSVLSGEADDAVTGLADAIDVVNQRVVANRRQVLELRAELPYQEWVRWIAAVHAEADALLEETGRLEPTPEQWEQLRFCESSGDYNARTFFTVDENAFGAYQFEAPTWATVGGFGSPGDAHPVEQDARARLLHAKRGRQPWPFCGRYLRPGA